MSSTQHVEVLLAYVGPGVFTAAASYLLGKWQGLPRWPVKPQVDVHNRERKVRITAPNCDPFAIAIEVKHG